MVNVVTGVLATLTVPLLLVAWLPQHRPRPGLVALRLVHHLVASAMLSVIALIAGFVVSVLPLLGGIIGMIVAVVVVVWLVGRTVALPASTMLDGQSAMSAIGHTWRSSRGFAPFFGVGAVIIGFMGLMCGAIASAHSDAAAFAANAGVSSLGLAGLLAWIWPDRDELGDKVGRAPSEDGGTPAAQPTMTADAPVRLVTWPAAGPGEARLVRLASQDDIEGIRSANGPVWALAQTHDQELIARAIQEGAQVLVADQALRLRLGLFDLDSPGLATLSSDGIRWQGHLYRETGPAWVRA